MKITLPIAKLSLLIEEYKQIKLQDNKEISVNDLDISVPTPNGQVKVNQFIKKYNLPILEILLENGYRFKAAETHIVQVNGTDVYLKDITAGGMIDHRTGAVNVLNINSVGYEDCYDISIPAPHLYYDANGVIHHNTITTATLAKLCEPYGRTITIVPNKSLVEQTEEDFVNVGLDVGVYYGDRKDLGRTHIICTWQSLNILDKKTKNNELAADTLTLAEFLNNVSCVMVDEVHQAKAEVLRNLLTQNLNNACIRWGLTGTVPKDPAEHETIFASLGPVVGQIKTHELQESGVLAKCHVNVMQLIDLPVFKTYAQENKYLVTDPDRLKFIAKMIQSIATTGNTLVLVSFISTGKQLVDLIPESTFVSGEVKTTDRKETYDEIGTSDNMVLVASYGVAAVGLNLPRLFNLVLLEPGKSFVRVIQSIGRGVRKAADKDFVNVYDVTSTCKFSKKHLTERKKFYKEAKYDFTVNRVDWTK